MGGRHHQHQVLVAKGQPWRHGQPVCSHNLKLKSEPCNSLAICRSLHASTPNGEETAPAEACRNGTDACPIGPERDSFPDEGPELAQTSAKVRAMSLSLAICRSLHASTPRGEETAPAEACRNGTDACPIGPERDSSL